MKGKRELWERGLFDIDDEPMPSGHWAVPWSDLMMVAFVLFAVLYSYVLSHRDIGDALKKPAKISGARTPAGAMQRSPEVTSPAGGATSPAGATGAGTMEELYDSLEKSIRVSKLEDVTVELEKDNTIKVSVGEPLLFDSGRAELKPSSTLFLRELADRIVATRYKVVVEGHTDSFPVHSAGYQTNWELSTARAIKVARFLIEDGGLEPERFSVVGYSMYKPVVPNSSPINKARNRRVEILITKEKIE